MANDQQRKLIQFIIDSNFKREKPYIESIDNQGLMKVRFIEKLPFFKFKQLNES